MARERVPRLMAKKAKQLSKEVGPAVFGSVISGAMLFSGRAALATEILKDGASVGVFLTRCASAGALCELLANPILGKLSDRFGRRAVIPLGNGSVILCRLLIFMRPKEVWPMVVEQVVVVPMMTSFFITWRAACSDVLEGTAYAQFQAKMGVYAGVALIIGPVVGQVIMARMHVKYCFLTSVVLSSLVFAHLLLNFTETLPPEKRKPLENILGDMQPLSFMQVMRKSKALNRLMLITGLQTATEGRNISDLLNVYLANDLKWDWSQINKFVGAFGIALVVSGVAAKDMVKTLGLRRFFFVSNLSNFLGNLMWGNAPPLNLVLSSSAGMWLGILVTAFGGRKRDAAEALIMKLGAREGFGRGFLSGAQNNWRAIINIIFPLVFGSVYARMSKHGRPQDVFLVASITIVLAEVCFQSLTDREIGVNSKGEIIIVTPRRPTEGTGDAVH